MHFAKTQTIWLDVTSYSCVKIYETGSPRLLLKSIATWQQHMKRVMSCNCIGNDVVVILMTVELQYALIVPSLLLAILLLFVEVITLFQMQFGSNKHK